jgi:hypothetical protein
MLSRAQDGGYLAGEMKDYIGREAEKGWIHPFEPYREVHEQNLKRARSLEGQDAA